MCPIAWRRPREDVEPLAGHGIVAERQRLQPAARAGCEELLDLAPAKDVADRQQLRAASTRLRNQERKVSVMCLRSGRQAGDPIERSVEHRQHTSRFGRLSREGMEGWCPGCVFGRMAGSAGSGAHVSRPLHRRISGAAARRNGRKEKLYRAREAAGPAASSAPGRPNRRAPGIAARRSPRACRRPRPSNCRRCSGAAPGRAARAAE